MSDLSQIEKMSVADHTLALSLDINASDPPLELLIVVTLTQSEKVYTKIVWHRDPLYLNGKPYNTILKNKYEAVLAANSLEITRYYAREIDIELYGGTCHRRKTEVDHWMLLSVSNLITKKETLDHLNDILLTQTWLVDKKMTLADIYVFNSLQKIDIAQFQENHFNIARWFKLVQSLPAVQNALSLLKEHQLTAVNPRRSLHQQGKFTDLPGAQMGKLVVRFPPEASGYLHIGHAKAALLNQYYAETYNGQLVMRFDDTNPAKETVEFEEAILQDLELLKIKPDRFTHTSDYFDRLEKYCTILIESGKAFVDDTMPELMKAQRDEKIKSENRDNSVEINLQLWEEMRRGTEIGQRCCVRAKIDYESKNGCLRDPTIYRCKSEAHPRTEDKYKVYPTYDFACPLVDFIENVTHPLRTTEYEDRDDQYRWILQQFKHTTPFIVSYSRLNMTHTVLSKRKLTWFVDQGLVDGWDDPRMPTIRGILRRGMTVEALKDFIIAQGSSRSVVVMEWDKIWAFNKKVIDPEAVRYTALNYQTMVKVNVLDAKKGILTIPNHPKDPLGTKLGTKQVQVGPKLLIEREDAERLIVEQNATFINWGNLMILKINRDHNNVIISVDARLNLEDKNYKDTLKITWLTEPEHEKPNSILCYAVYFDHLLSVPTLPKDSDFKLFVNTSTRKEDLMLGEMELQRVKKGEIIQLQRKGFFICDVPYASVSPYSSREQPLILFHIPDGHATTVQKTQKLQEQVDEKKKTDKVKKLKKNEPEILDSKSLSTAQTLSQNIQEQFIKVQNLQTRLELEMKVLSDMKIQHKNSTGQEWDPAAIRDKEMKSKAEKIAEEIQKQSDKVGNLIYSTTDKNIIGPEMKIYFSLKSDYKNVTGQDWKPDQATTVNAVGDKKMEIKEKTSKPVGATVASTVSDTKTESKEETLKAKQIAEEIQKQGDKVRNLKSSKADRSIIVQEMKILLSLKNDYKDTTGQNWKSGQTTTVSTVGDKKTEIKKKTSKPVEATVASTVGDTKTESKEETLKAEKIAAEIEKQGDKVRSLKSSKADKSIIDQEVKILLSLKSDYKNVTGLDWKPGQTSVASEVNKSTKTKSKEESLKVEKIAEEIQKQGDKVRSLKSSKADKSIIDQEVKILLSLKSDYKNATGQDWKPGQIAAASAASTADDKAVRDVSKSDGPKSDSSKLDSSKSDSSKLDSSKKSRLGLEVKKEENFFDWYSQVITKTGMIEYYDVSGCYILRPWSFEIWKTIKDYIEKHLSGMNVQECYFPIFVTRDALEKEKTHIADFAPEVAWVTKCGNSDLAEPVAIRPTSETIMYPAYAKWLRSDTELPLKLNQWNNVVRWEFKDPKPFLRTREFLWQEGHTAFATKAEAEAEVLAILDMYANVYEEMLAVPVIKGRKTEKEKFAGGEYTTTVEAFIPTSGRAIQGATSHHLGQNFSKMFNIQVEGIAGSNEKTFVYQNSWGLTTRTIGVMIMLHGDDTGLVLPPNVAPIQAIVIPCGISAKATQEQKDKINSACVKLVEKFQVDGKFRVRGDFRNNRTVGWKYCNWELKGVPVRIELGPKEVANDEVMLVRRDTAEMHIVKLELVVTKLAMLLIQMQEDMLQRARTKLNEHIKLVENWADFITEFNKRNLLLAPFCGEPECEDNIKADSATTSTTSDEFGTSSMGAKSLCIPFKQPESTTPLDKLTCVHTLCGKKPKYFTLFGRSY